MPRVNKTGIPFFAYRRLKSRHRTMPEKPVSLAMQCLPVNQKSASAEVFSMIARMPELAGADPQRDQQSSP